MRHPRLPYGLRSPLLCATLLLTALQPPLAGCGGGGSSNGAPTTQPGPTYDPLCPLLAIQLLPLDIWGRPLAAPVIEARDEQGRLVASRSGQAGSLRLPLPAAGGTLACAVSAEKFLPAVLTAVYHGGRDEQAVALTDEAAPLGVPGRALSLDAGTVDGRSCPVVTLYLGLDHTIFAASGRPAESGNAVRLMMDGEEQWAATAQDLRTAVDRVWLSTWWWQSDFELERGPEQPTQEEAARWPHTMIALLDGLPAGVPRRILVNRFLPATVGGIEYLNTDSELRTRGRTAGSGYQLLLQGNPTVIPFDREVPLVEQPIDFAARIAARCGLQPRHFLGADAAAGATQQQALDLEIDAASYHQKAIVVDGRVGYIGGMNIKSTDWDTNAHRVWEEKRMKFHAPVADRQAVAERRLLPDLGPRKDYFVRFEGPLVADVEDVLCARWGVAVQEQDEFFANATACTAPPWQGTGAPGNVEAQVVVSLPAPLAEHSILESLRKAVGRAEQLIYIEDQYFRMPVLNDALVAALTRHPDLQLVVITMDLSAADGGKRWTLESDRQLRQAGGDRYHLLQLYTFDAALEPDGGDPALRQVQWVGMDTHSKLVIVDDSYMTVGSCNKNNRGLKFEGEMNLAVLDQPFVRAARDRIFANLIGPRRAGELTGDPAHDVALFEEVAAANATRQRWWTDHGAVDARADVAAALEAERPDGFLLPLAFDETMDLPDVGPDVF